MVGRQAEMMAMLGSTMFQRTPGKKFPAGRERSLLVGLWSFEGGGTREVGIRTGWIDVLEL